MQLVPDPGFDSPVSWNITTHEGAAVVAGGKLTCTAWRGNITATLPTPVVGEWYQWSVKVDSLVANGLIAVQYGGIDGGLGGPVLWTGAQGAGTFTGRGPATTTGSLNIAVSLTASDLTLDFVEVYDLHVRQSIREAVELAVTGLSTTGANVFPSQVYNLQTSQLPALQVISASESIELELGTLDAPQRAFDVTIKGTARATTNLDNTLDDIAEEVEAALGADVTLGGLSHGLDLVGTSFDYSGDSDQPVGDIELVYRILYRTPFGDPTTVA